MSVLPHEIDNAWNAAVENLCARWPTMSRKSRRRVLFFLAALGKEGELTWPDGREGVRQRLLFAEKYLGNVSLRDERGKLRRGELLESDLSTLEELGIDAAWIMAGAYPGDGVA